MSHALEFQVSLLLRSQNPASDMADLTRLQRLFGLQYHLPAICPSQPDRARGGNRPDDLQITRARLQHRHQISRQSLQLYQQYGDANCHSSKFDILHLVWPFFN